MRSRISLTEPPHVLLPTEARRPNGLRDLTDPPCQLLVAGRVPDLTRAVAIVGTRYADADALSFTRRLARELGRAGCPVVSGGAVGIDAVAHAGALEAGGSTVAVLATGVVSAYPTQHAELFAQIAGTGALLSEFDRKGVGGGWAFLKRNRLVAALAPVVVIVQAPIRSGALSTARWAKLLKRRLFVVPAAPWDPRGTGCLELLRDGAEICTSAADILSVAAPGVTQTQLTFSAPTKDLNDSIDLPKSAQAVRKWLRNGPAQADQISTALDMPAAEVQEALLTLLLAGFCWHRSDGTYEAHP
jgi:DNA processing protein